VRLGTCIAGELAVGIAMAAGVVFAGTWGVRHAPAMLDGEAQAASLSADDGGYAPVVRFESVGAIEARAKAPPPVAADSGMAFFGVPDDELLAPLRGAGLERIKFNRGGSGVSFRIDFAGGGRVAFKPDQINVQSEPRHELAAYRIDRLLGIGATAPCIPMRFRMDDVYNHLDGRFVNSVARIAHETITHDGWLYGAASWWIPVIDFARVSGYPIDSYDGKVAWKWMLTIGRPIPPGDAEMARQISNLLLFDHLINNMDRWTGNNTRSSTDQSKLYFMDNALSFGNKPEGGDNVIVFLHRAQRFSRRLVGRLRTLTIEEVRKAVGTDLGPYERILEDSEIDALMHRRDFAIAYIDELIRAHGEDAVLVFP
jgi:hypothetical protein